MAILILLSAAAGTGIVGINLCRFALLGLLLKALVFVGTGNLCNLLTLYLLLNLYGEEQTNSILFDSGLHSSEHIKSANLEFSKRILLAHTCKARRFLQLIHIIDVAHPLTIDHTEEYDTLNFTDLLGLREFGFFCFVKLDCLFLKLLDKRILFLSIYPA